MRDPALDIAQLSKRFAPTGGLLRWLTRGRGQRTPTVALDRIDLTVQSGEIVGVLGPNGSGKSTLLRCAAGLVVPDSGSVRVLGADPGRVGSTIRGRVGLVGRDDRSFDFRLTGRQNLEFFGRLQNAAGDALDARIREVIALTRLRDVADMPFRTYSTGMRQRLAVARAVLGYPALLLLDEASSGLDPGKRAALYAVLKHLADNTGVAVVLATHDLTEAQYLCSRLIVLDAGRIAAEGEYLAVEPVAEELFARDRADREVL